MTIEEIYKEEYVPAWKECHEGMGGEPACFEEWKENEFKESIKSFLDDMSYEQKVAIMISYCQSDRACSIPYPDYMESIDECGSFTDLYDKIDHDNFNIRHDLFYENGSCLVSCDFGDFVNDYWDLDDMTEYVVDNFNDLYTNDYIIDDFEYEYE